MVNGEINQNILTTRQFSRFPYCISSINHFFTNINLLRWVMGKNW